MFKLPEWDAEWFMDKQVLKYIAPDWKTELQMATMPINTFVALTMDCNKDVATLEPCARLSTTGMIIVGYSYNKRLRVIENNLLAGSFPGKYQFRLPHTCRLKEAIQWVHDQGWELPGPMLKLIKPGQKEKKAPEEFPRTHPKWRLAYEFESEGINALNDLIEKYFFDEKGNPINNPKRWPAKKTLESEWLKNRTLSEADTIITSGKRIGNAKK